MTINEMQEGSSVTLTVNLGSEDIIFETSVIQGFNEPYKKAFSIAAEPIMKDGKIVATGGTLDEPAACGIMTKDRRRWITAFVLENGTINIHVDMKKNYLQHVGGTPINNEMNAILTESKQNTSNPTLFRQNIYRIVNGIIEKPLKRNWQNFLNRLMK